MREVEKTEVVGSCGREYEILIEGDLVIAGSGVFVSAALFFLGGSPA